MCCFLVDKQGIPTTKPCPHLIFLKSGRTLCRSYKDRIGKVIGSVDGYKNVCTTRNNSACDFLGCEYNDGTKIVYEVSKREVKKV